MICKNCGNETTMETIFCSKCGAKLESDFVRPEFNQTDGISDDPIPENMRYESMNEQNNDNTWSGEGADNGGYSQSEYRLADLPVKKEKKKRPLWLALICSMFSFVFGMILFILCVTLLYAAVINSSISEVRSTFSSSGDARFSEIPVGEILNKFDSSKEYDSDVTLSQYVYDKLPEADKANTTEEDMAELINNPSISDFVNGVMDDYIGVMTGENDEASVTNESIIQVVKDNEKLVEAAIGRELSDEDYKKIDNRLDSIGFEDNTKIKGSNEAAGEIQSVLRIARMILDNTKMIFVVLGVAIGIVLIILLLLNLNKPYRVLRHAGACTIMSAVIGFATASVFDMLLRELGSSERASFEMVMRFIGNPQDKISSYSGYFLTIGIVLMVVYTVIAISRKILSSRA